MNNEPRHGHCKTTGVISLQLALESKVHRATALRVLTAVLAEHDDLAACARALGIPRVVMRTEVETMVFKHRGDLAAIQVEYGVDLARFDRDPIVREAWRIARKGAEIMAPMTSMS